MSDQEADVENDGEEPSTLAIQPSRGLWPRQTPDRYTSVRSVRSMPGPSRGSTLSTSMLLGLLLVASTLSRYEPSSGCREGNRHLGEYSNTSPSVSGDVALIDPMVGGSPLLTESLLD